MKEIRLVISRLGGEYETQVHVQVVAGLLSEIVLCIKEVNQRTRVAAYQLLVGLAHAMHEAEPPQLSLANDTDMGESANLHARHFM